MEVSGLRHWILKVDTGKLRSNLKIERRQPSPPDKDFGNLRNLKVTVIVAGSKDFREYTSPQHRKGPLTEMQMPLLKTL
ncbi:hypothetical protein AVEN_227960-1 [Araneus ventricosus]|uniref:Uncharacterized protein n=1 Tax=Araneus ventricosus TaxID=182803 RepID=A0A4Y2NNZ7_ARAVE|nr:hypothetical protein AVEN_227960-1 [Araneus ventricosus]